MPVLFLLSDPKWGFPHFPDKREIYAKSYVHHGRNVRIQPPKLSKFPILRTNFPLRGDSFAQFLKKLSAFVRAYRKFLNF